MKLLVDALSSTPRSFAFEAAPEWLAPILDPDGVEAPGPLAIGLTAYRMGEDLLLEGRIEGGLGLECSRCLARYRDTLHEPFRLVLESAGAREPADPEAARALAEHGVCLGDEIETGWFRGTELHLGAFFQELIALSLPVKPLCREECPGLCPRCGAERAAGPCDCHEVRPDSPFAVLAALRGEPSRGGD